MALEMSTSPIVDLPILWLLFRETNSSDGCTYSDLGTNTGGGYVTHVGILNSDRAPLLGGPTLNGLKGSTSKSSGNMLGRQVGNFLWDLRV